MAAVNRVVAEWEKRAREQKKAEEQRKQEARDRGEDVSNDDDNDDDDDDVDEVAASVDWGILRKERDELLQKNAVASEKASELLAEL